jgi:hypothetical protein
MSRSSARVLGGCVLAVAIGAVARTSAQSATSRLEAAFVSKFPQFVEWPAAAIEGRTSIDVCVAQPDPFGADLDALVAGETLNGRPLAARRVDREGDVSACHVLFIPSQNEKQANPLLQKAGPLPILTVSDDPRFLDDGGIVRLRIVDGRVRFDVNAAAARRSGLRLSSQLLQLAVEVRGAGGGA